MAEDPKHPWGSGATRYVYAPAVERVVQSVTQRFPLTSANTYVCHPWCGWGKWSVDFWGPGGRGDPIRPETAERTLRFLYALPGLPNIRHTIYEHRIWTSWGGLSYWSRNDHTGPLRHVHVTYYPMS